MIRINYGCGRRVLSGYVNVDAVVHPKAERAPEVLHALRFNEDGSIVDKTPMLDDFADELLAAHILEHFYGWETQSVLAEWKRLLKPGAKLILELPNIEAAARNLLAGMRPQMWEFAFYGDHSHRDPYMCHRQGFTPASVKRAVEDAGFTRVQILPPQTHGPRPNRDMRVEAMKP